MDFIEKQLNRRSERSLDANKPLLSKDIQILKDVINSSPSSINGQGASAIFIQDKDMIAKMSSYNWNQEHILKAPLFILFVGDMNRIKYAYELQGKKDWELNDINFQELITVGTVDATIKAQSVVDASLALGMGTCYIGGIRLASKKLIKDLNLPDYVFPIVGLTVGYINEQQPKKPKMNSVFMEKYNDSSMKKEVIEYDELMTKYYDKRLFNKKVSKWSLETMNTYEYCFSGSMYDEYNELLKSKFKSKK